MYLRTPASKAQQQQLEQQKINQAIQNYSPIEFWCEHQTALNWWWQVQDLMRYNGAVCMGLDVLAVKADSELSGREVSQEDYLKLRLIAQTVTELVNDKLGS